MYLSKRLILLLLLPISLSTVHLNSVAQISHASTNQLNEQMKQFHKRLAIYIKCLKGTCTPQERQAAAQTVRHDAAILVGTTLAVGTGAFLARRYGWSAWKKYSLAKSKKYDYKKAEAIVQQSYRDSDIATQKYKEAEGTYMLLLAESNRLNLEQPHSIEAQKAYNAALKTFNNLKALEKKKNAADEKARSLADEYLKLLEERVNILTQEIENIEQKV